MTNLTLTGLSATNDIRGVKPPLVLPNQWGWLWWSLLAFVVFLTAFLLWRERRRKQHLPPVIVILPHVRARRQLQEALQFLTDPNRFCTLVADAVRLYLEERFDLRAPERTTEEFLVELQTSRHLTPDQKQSLGEFLQSCDLVKFARFEPTEEALRQLHAAALRLVDETQFDPVETVLSPQSAVPRGQSAVPSAQSAVGSAQSE